MHTLIIPLFYTHTRLLHDSLRLNELAFKNSLSFISLVYFFLTRVTLRIGQQERRQGRRQYYSRLNLEDSPGVSLFPSTRLTRCRVARAGFGQEKPGQSSRDRLRAGLVGGKAVEWGRDLAPRGRHPARPGPARRRQRQP